MADRRKATIPLKRKALEPHQRYCRFVDKKVTVLVEYLDYKTPFNKGEEGTLYCGNMLECYHNQIQCRHSGISPLYPDPFQGAAKDFEEEPCPEAVENPAPTQPENSDVTEEPLIPTARLPQG